MANDVTKNPIALDTVGAVFPSGTYIVPRSIRWVGATLAAHACILKDASGRIKWRDIASGANYVGPDKLDERWNGLTVDTLGSGIVYIEVG